MNGSIIRYILGLVIRIECLLLLVPCFVGFLYDEPERYSYMFVAIICFVVGTVLTIVKPKENVFHLKEGCVTTALSIWRGTISTYRGNEFFYRCDVRNGFRFYNHRSEYSE